ncbi:peptidase C25 [Porphyromonas gulae]|uniref:C25 family peptidase propeptide domain-containing protein n=1 Tax=Porphyromonas gulae TaxID=111105 RepID=UPI00052BDBD8|nr:C25 family peptidase propeptide domain-containing protein [Porphyromonas gulae]KGN77541.1 peptidase C25 [Porphyromonas gulae]
MRKILSFLMMCSLHLGLQSQTWHGDPDSVAALPSIGIQESSCNRITFEVVFPGFYSVEKREGNQVFQRISMPGCGSFGNLGEAELPVLKKMIAVPEFSIANVAVNIKESETFYNYNIYPNPAYVVEELPDGGGTYPAEAFAINNDYYSQNVSLPSTHYVYSQDGYFRSQRFIEVTLYPFRYNPVRQEILFAKKIEVTITFDNPQPPLQKNTGIFNKVASSGFINYEADGKSAIENDMVLSRGTTTYISGNIANNLPQNCDYLVIYDDMFSVNQQPHDEIKRLCEHRAFYNGFDVVAVSIKDVLNSFTSNATSYINETKLKNFIRSVYNQNNAKRTLDGKLGYVLLIGKPLSKYLADTDNTKVPTSFIHNVSYTNHTTFPSDYFLSCISGEDSIGDLFIGRFSVTNSDELYNLVEKTINKEVLYNPIAEKSILYAEGRACGYPNLRDFMKKHAGGHIFNSVLDPPVPNSIVARDSMFYWLNKGVNYFYFYTHGTPITWTLGLLHLNIDTLTTHLNNVTTQGLCTSLSCGSTTFDSTFQSLGEALTTYAPNKGFSVFLGASRSTPYLDNTAEIDYPTPSRFHEYLPYSLYHNLSTVVGEMLLSSIINTNSVDTYSKFNFNLLGDPALNIMAHGMEVSNCITLPNNTIISSPITIKNGGCLKIPEKGVLHFTNNGSIQVMSGGTLEIGNQAKISGETGAKPAFITVYGDGLAINKQVEIDNIDRLNLFSTHSVMPKFRFDSVKFNSAPLYTTNCIVEISNCEFTNRSDIISKNCDLRVENSMFSSSGITVFKPMATSSITGLSTKAKITDNTFFATGNFAYHITNTPDLTATSNAAIKLDNIPEYYISGNKIVNCDEALVLNNSGNRTNRLHNITRNVIKNCRIGSTLYNSYGIYNRNKISNNHIGVRLLNNSCFYFDNAPVINEEDKQTFISNRTWQLYSSNGTFPLNFHYNSLQGGDTDTWIYNDTYANRYIDVSNNHWGNNDLFDPNQVFNTPDLFIWIPFWNGLPNGRSGNSSAEAVEFQTALDYIGNSDYLSAKVALKMMVETYPESDFAIAALKELFRIEKMSGNDYEGLKDYFRSNPTIISSQNLFPTADFLSARCDIVCENYQSAIDWYENRLNSEISYQDSVFAVIDLGDIYWNMQLDSLRGTGIDLNILSCEQRKSLESHQNVKNYLLSTLPKSTGTLLPPLECNKSSLDKSKIISISPNPAKAVVTIIYYTDNPSCSVIKIYGINGASADITGLPKHLSEGYYSIQFNTSNFDPGFYLVTLNVDQKIIDTEKLRIK